MRRAFPGKLRKVSVYGGLWRRIPWNVPRFVGRYSGPERRISGNVARLRAGQGGRCSIVGGYERAFLFSCGYFCAESHCGGRGGSQGKRHRTQQTQRFQSDPPRAGTRIGAERVYGRPTWTACGTRSIGRIPQYGKRGRRKQPSVGFARRHRGRERAPCRFQPMRIPPSRALTRTSCTC